MMSIDEALTSVRQAVSAGQLSASAAEAIGRWLSESPFAKYRPRLLADIAAGRWKAAR